MDFEMMAPAESKRLLTCYKCYGRIHAPGFDERVEAGKIKMVIVEGDLHSFHASCLTRYLNDNPTTGLVKLSKNKFELVEGYYKLDYNCKECHGVIKRADVKSHIGNGKVVRVKNGINWEHYHTKCLLKIVEDGRKTRTNFVGIKRSIK